MHFSNMRCTHVYKDHVGDDASGLTHLLAAFQLVHKLVNGRQLIWRQAKDHSNLSLILGIELEVGFETPPLFFQLTHLTLKAVVHSSQL